MDVENKVRNRTHVSFASVPDNAELFPPIVFASQTRTVQSALPLTSTEDSALKLREWMG